MLAAALALALAAPSRCVEVAALTDLHGHADALPQVAARLSEVRQRGPTVVLDAGDSLQGTLEASLSRGEVAVAGYGALGLDATAVGNHDFDYGLEVLRQRAAAAPFPFLLANARMRATGAPPDWPNLRPRRLLHPAGGPAVGVFGLATKDTPTTTMPSNVAELRFVSAAREAQAQSAALRAEGAEVVVALAHIGGRCRDLSDPDDLSTCDPDSELFALVRRLRPGTVDVVVGGHTHAFVNHRLNGAALVQAGAWGRALGWVTACAGAPPQFHPFLRIGRGQGQPGSDARVAAAIAPFFAAARSERERLVGVRLGAPLTRSRRRLSPLGAVAAASVRAALGTDLGLVNAGALRADLPAGELTYGQLYEALPFEDHLAVVTLSGVQVEAVVRALGRGRGYPQLAGFVYQGGAARTCAGKPLDAAASYTLGTTEFLASGGDGLRLLARLPRSRIAIRSDLRLRDAVAERLRKTAAAEMAAACP